MGVSSLADLLDASAARFPERAAVVDSSGRVLRYSELSRQADGFARFLRSRGVEPGDRVAIALPKEIAAAVAVFGVLKAGAVYVPVDAAGPAERGRRILEDCGVRAAVVNRRSVVMVPPAASGRVLTICLDENRLPPVDDGPGPARAAADDARSELAYIIFTSGSTGVPKGVPISHRSALSFLEWCSSEFHPTEHDRFSAFVPLHFDPSVFDLFLAIKHGAAVHLISEDLARRPKELAAYIAAARLTFWSSTPSALIMLVQHGELDAHPAPSLRVVMFGGEVFPPKPLLALRRHWPSPAYYNLYGPTETTVTCTFLRLPREMRDDRTEPYPIGFPCPHCRAAVLDENGREVRPGEEGLLHISGPSVFAGYWNRPDETAAAFREHDGARWYNTGDLVRWDPAEGFTYVGRNDRMIKRRGFRIELGEIERRLCSHPGVREAAVVSLREDGAGVRIAAFLACDGQAPSLVAIKTFCAAALPAYMSPDSVVVRDSLPRTSTGKIDYQHLANEAADACRA